jgi:hypothetical protein
MMLNLEAILFKLNLEAKKEEHLSDQADKYLELEVVNVIRRPDEGKFAAKVYPRSWKISRLFHPRAQ